MDESMQDRAAKETTVSDLEEQLAQLHRDHPTSEMTEVAQLMIQQLDLALHGQTWARPRTPRQVWADLLGKVEALVASSGRAAHTEETASGD